MDKVALINMESIMKKEGPPPPYEPSLSETHFEVLYSKATFMMKYTSLATLTLQNASLNLMMRYARMQKELFISSTAVLMAEIMKLFICLFMIGFVEEKSFWMLLNIIKRDILKQPLDTLKVAIPSFVYLLQNNLLYIGATHLDAATCQVTYQLKILTTAILSVMMLKKRLSYPQWISLVTLFIGVAIVQLAQLNAPSSGHLNHEQKPLLGMTAIVAACCLSGFAGVYFEKILKSTDEVSLWIRNIQLCFASIPLGLVTVAFMDWEEVSTKGFFYAYNATVWIVIILQAGGGIIVAVVVKFADNILKGFATSLAIILSCVISVYILNFKLTAQFVVGATLVMGSVYLYGRPPSSTHKK
ncbi:UDP-galactose translocator [Trichonephila inaurata madagascariensis]|uniref:UDP-galactose translocator n=1 Tax=Trichonephila inaurata madagascariensis TaxID=2747483 RepID=A0A8X6XNX8_9ARAC|nr:UDP-galactose translocator [Trichonephila inaurata madagascariensis]